METLNLLIASVFIFFMAGVFLTWFFIHKAKTKERLMLIEKGIDLSPYSQDFKFETNFPWLKMGIVIASMGLGLLLGSVYNERVITTGLVLLFGGAGMVISNYLDKPKVQK
jgi:hypothetical protein